MTQVAIAIFGLTALWLALDSNARARKWAPVVGLVGQPFWLYFSWQAAAWGLLVVSIGYTLVYLRGAFVQWGYE